MHKDSDYIVAYSHATTIGNKPLGVKILVELGRDITDKEDCVIWNQGEMVFNELWKGHVLQDQERVLSAREQKEKILALFAGRDIFVEEIPNGYCSQPCCVNLPWFVVTTSIGHVKLGWRKHVIEINWEKTLQKKKADELFPGEDVTKDNYYIHAWGYDKAKEYLDVIHKL